MTTSLTRALLALTMAMLLTACGGGSGGSSAAPEDSNNDDSQTPITDSNDNNSSDPDEETPPAEGFTEQDEAVLLGLLDSNNNFTVAVCPSTVLDLPFGGAIDALACENEALQNLSIDNNQVLGLLCANTVAAQPGSLPDTLAEPTFLPACLLESADYLQQNLTGLFDGTSPLLGDTCQFSANIAECITHTLASTPQTLFGVLEILGCDNPTDPQLCFTSAAEKFASGELLLGSANTLSTALCPLSTAASSFDPASCVTEVLTGVGSVLGLSGDLQQICGSDADPLSCLLAAGDQFAVITDLLGDNPLSAELVDNLIAGLGDPANGELLDMLPGLLEQIPVLGDLLGDQLGNGDTLFATLGDLQGLSGLADNIPLLGDLLNGLAGGDMGALPGDLPLDSLDLDSLLAALDPSQLEQISSLFNDVPVLGELTGQLLGGLDCAQADPLDCLVNLGSQFTEFASLLEQIPLLGELLVPVFDVLLGTNHNNPLDSLTTVLSGVPVVGEVLDGLLGTLLGGTSGGDLLGPISGIVDQQPGFQGVLDGVLGGLLSGNPDELFSGILDGNGDLLGPVGDLILADPVIGDLLAGLLLDQLGEDATLAILAPLGDALQSLPILGPILDGLLGGLLGLFG